jgi:putative acetyltransferase
MPAIHVRARESRDFEAIAEIMGCPGVIAGTLQLPYRSLDERREHMAHPDPRSHHLVAEIDGRVVGSLGLHVETPLRRRHVAALGMAVHDQFQGRGVGSALLAAAVDLADNWLGLHRLELHVYTDNAPAIHLYQKFGFVIEGTARHYGLRNGVYADAHGMARLRSP